MDYGIRIRILDFENHILDQDPDFQKLCTDRGPEAQKITIRIRNTARNLELTAACP